jgi:hypothetical protein
MSSKLNVKQWIIAAIAAFIFVSIWQFLMGRFFFPALFPATSTPAPQPENAMLARLLFYLGRAIFALLFVFIYTRGYEGKPGVGEGLRYGVWMGLLIYVPGMFINFVVSTTPTDLIITRVVTGLIETILSGIITGAIYKGQPKPTT